MRSKNWSLALAIMWTACFIVDIISAAAGEQPTWTMVFCPLFVLVFNRWSDYAIECMEEKYKNGD